jgi:CubicO group peptidase (beta-lactamase class C family)
MKLVLLSFSLYWVEASLFNPHGCQEQIAFMDATYSGALARNGPFTPGFSKLVEQAMDEWKVPGLAIAVVDGDNTFHQVGINITR